MGWGEMKVTAQDYMESADQEHIFLAPVEIIELGEHYSDVVLVCY